MEKEQLNSYYVQVQRVSSRSTTRLIVAESRQEAARFEASRLYGEFLLTVSVIGYGETAEKLFQVSRRAAKS